MSQNNHRMYSVVLIAWLVSILASGTACASSDLRDFNPLPDLSGESQIPNLDQIVKTANSLLGDSREEAPLQACDWLVNNPSTPPALMRWAYLRRFEILCYTGDEWTGTEIAREWLRLHPDDPSAVNIRFLVAEAYVHRNHDGFQPTHEQYMEVFEDLFSHHDPHHWDVIAGRMLLAETLYGDAGRHPTEADTMRQRAIDELTLAEQAVTDLAEGRFLDESGLVMPKVAPDKDELISSQQAAAILFRRGPERVNVLVERGELSPEPDTAGLLFSRAKVVAKARQTQVKGIMISAKRKLETIRAFKENLISPPLTPEMIKEIEESQKQALKAFADAQAAAIAQQAANAAAEAYAK